MTKYTPVGIVDDFLDPKENNGSKFSIQGRARHLSVQSAKQRIEDIRKYKGDLISATPSNNAED
ncbi:MAG: hypothetical protein ACMG6E_09380 [Candidatus Roizmanbacteria bacterium]